MYGRPKSQRWCPLKEHEREYEVKRWYNRIRIHLRKCSYASAASIAYNIIPLGLQWYELAASERSAMKICCVFGVARHQSDGTDNFSRAYMDVSIFLTRRKHQFWNYVALTKIYAP